MSKPTTPRTPPSFAALVQSFFTEHLTQQRAPRMVKRRNTQYAPHDRTVRTRVRLDCSPQPLAAPPGAPMPRKLRKYKPARHSSPTNSSGDFFI
jgi:hypothetical protein